MKGTTEPTKKQTDIVTSNYSNKENGLNQVMQMVLNVMMISERKAFLQSSDQTKANEYRLGKVFGHVAQLELSIPRDRKSEFKPILLALFIDQEAIPQRSQF